MSAVAALLASVYAEPVLLIVKATLLLATAGALTLLLRRRDAAGRHLVWTLALAVLLVLPVAAWAVPDWRVPLVALPANGGNEVGGVLATALVPAPARHQVSGTSGAPTHETAESAAAATPGSGRWPVLTPRGLLLVWAIGVAVVLAWLLIGRIALWVVLRRSAELEGPAWDEARQDAAWLLDVKRPVRLHRSRSAAMPVTWGVFRPVVLLPDEADSWTVDRRRIVLLHELSHVARWDCMTQLLAGVACAVYWFHPGVWYAARRMRVERELACDDRVLAAGTPAREYASHLLELAQRYRAVTPAPMVALHMARPNQLEGRLLTVLSGASGRRPPTRAHVIGAALATALLTLPLSGLQPTPAPLPSLAQGGVAAPDDGAAGERSADAPARDSIVERDVPARAGETLVLDLRTGGIVEITSWDEDRVRVRARLSGRSWRESAVSVQRSAHGVDVVAWKNEGNRDATSHTFDIRVPRRFNVQLASAGGGVTIRNLEGRFRGHTNGGDLRLSDSRGEARLSTGGGDVRVSDSELDGTVSTDVGVVTLVNVRGNLRGATTRAQADPSPPAQTGARAPAQPVQSAAAGNRGGSITINDSDSVARIVRRLPVSAAAHSLVTRDGQVALLLRDSTIVLQLTDRGLEDIGSGDVASAEDSGFLSALVGSMLRGGLRMLLDRGIEYSLTDLREARYADGRLILENREGDDIFSGVSVSGGKVMENFNPRDARAFASRVNAARARIRR